MRAEPRRRAAAFASCVLFALFSSSCDERSGPAALGDVERGRKLIGAYGCAGCHRIPGIVGENRLIGPPLETFARRSILAGRIPNQPPGLVRFLVDPQSVDPGTAMPDLGVTVEEARHMAAYLYSLAEPHAPGRKP